jgi:hypothetical protein
LNITRGRITPLTMGLPEDAFPRSVLTARKSKGRERAGNVTYHAIPRRQQLDYNDMGPILREMDAGECPKWKEMFTAVSSLRVFVLHTSSWCRQTMCWGAAGSQLRYNSKESK